VKRRDKGEIQGEKEAYTTFMNSETDKEKDISKVRYKVAKNEAKKAVAVAKSMVMTCYIKNWSISKVKRKFLNWQGLEKEEQRIWVL